MVSCERDGDCLSSMLISSTFVSKQQSRDEGSTSWLDPDGDG